MEGGEKRIFLKGTNVIHATILKRLTKKIRDVSN